MMGAFICTGHMTGATLGIMPRLVCLFGDAIYDYCTNDIYPLYIQTSAETYHDQR
jgi:hypothetical protein